MHSEKATEMPLKHWKVSSKTLRNSTSVAKSVAKVDFKSFLKNMKNPCNHWFNSDKELIQPYYC